jgi:hypothetical protein
MSELSEQDDIKKELRRSETEWNLERVRNIYKFDFFFAGLVFAALSFAMQFPVKSSYIYLVVAEGISWILFLIVGMCALYLCGGFLTRHTHGALEKRQERQPKVRFLMWVLFVTAVGILAIVKIVNLVYVALHPVCVFPR